MAIDEMLYYEMLYYDVNNLDSVTHQVLYPMRLKTNMSFIFMIISGKYFLLFLSAFTVSPIEHFGHWLKRKYVIYLYFSKILMKRFIAFLKYFNYKIKIMRQAEIKQLAANFFKFNF